MKYEDAILKLTVETDNGKMIPRAALIQYDDGWRMFCKFHGMDGIRTTIYPVDPLQMIDKAEQSLKNNRSNVKPFNKMPLND